MSERRYPCFLAMHNQIQHYAWGSKSALETLFGIPNPENKPQAEIWMGAHPNGCSMVTVNESPIALNDFIKADPRTILGERIVTQFGELPYLFKVLAAAQALSVQVHPSKSQAQAGFSKEEQAGVARSDAKRNYKDANHKPELVYALTPYQAMNGFRPVSEIIELFCQVDIPELKPLLSQFRSHPDANGLAHFFASVLSLQHQARQQAIDALLDYARQCPAEPLFELICHLAEQYPGDVGLFTPLFLNVVTLQPGEVMFLYACTPHAYLKGTGLEIMANSDNVLRAGLTPKYIDVDELLANTEFVSKAADSIRMQPQAISHGQHYPVPVQDFCFDIYRGQAIELNADSAEMIFAIDSEVILSHGSGESLTLRRGESAFIPACTGDYQLSSRGRIARAYC